MVSNNGLKFSQKKTLLLRDSISYDSKSISLIFLRVPFRELCLQQVTIMVKVFRSLLDNSSDFRELVAYNSIPVAHIFHQKQVVCGTATRNQTLEFYKHRHDCNDSLKEKYKSTDFGASFSLNFLSCLQSLGESWQCLVNRSWVPNYRFD